MWARWWFQTFFDMFTPKPGEMIQFDYVVQQGFFKPRVLCVWSKVPKATTYTPAFLKNDATKPTEKPKQSNSGTSQCLTERWCQLGISKIHNWERFGATVPQGFRSHFVSYRNLFFFNWPEGRSGPSRRIEVYNKNGFIFVNASIDFWSNQMYMP